MVNTHISHAHRTFITLQLQLSCYLENSTSSYCVYSLALRKRSVQSQLQMLFFIKNSDEFRVLTDTDEVSINYVHRQLSATVHIQMDALNTNLFGNEI